MKKLLIALLALAMVLSLAACGGKTQGQPVNTTPKGSEQTEPPKTDPPKTEPPATTPPETDPPKTEPSKTDPPETESPKTNPPETEPPKTDPPETEPPKTNPPETEPPQTNPPETEPPVTEPPQTEPEETQPQSSTPGFVGPGFPGIGGIGGQGGDTEDIPVADAGELVDTLDALCAPIVEGSYCGSLRSSGEFSNYFGGAVQYTEGMRVAANHLEMAPPAHIVLLIEVPEGENAETYAKNLKDNANPRWLVCATAQSVQYKVVGNLVLFVMTNEETANALIAAFNG